jgi:hypothetical protein
MTWTGKSYMTRSTRHDEHDWASPSRPLTGLAVWADAEWLRGGSGNAPRGSCTASNILRPIGDGTTSDFIWLLLSGSRSLLLETSSSPLPPRPRHPEARDDPAPLPKRTPHIDHSIVSSPDVDALGDGFEAWSGPVRRRFHLDYYALYA